MHNAIYACNRIQWRRSHNGKHCGNEFVCKYCQTLQSELITMYTLCWRYVVNGGGRVAVVMLAFPFVWIYYLSLWMLPFLCVYFCGFISRPKLYSAIATNSTATVCVDIRKFARNDFLP